MNNNESGYDAYGSISAVLAIYLPVHPSMQGVLIMLGIPSFLLGFLLLIPTLFFFLKSKIDRFEFQVFFILFCLVMWLVFKSLTSQSIGGIQFLRTLSSFILLILSSVCAYVAAKNSQVSLNTIAILGSVALIHFLYVLTSTGFTFGDLAFQSLSSNNEKQNYQSTAYYFGFVAVFFISQIFSYKNSSRKRLESFVFIIGVITLMSLVGARGAVIAILFTFLFIFIIAKRVRSFKLIVVTLLMVIVSMTVINIDFLLEHLTIFQRFQSLGDGSDSSKRVFLFTSALELWTSSPVNFIFGNGIATFPDYIGKQGAGWYPHNFLLECLAEAGIISVIPQLILFYFFYIKAKHYTDPNLYVYNFSLALAIYSLVNFQFIGGILTMWNPFFFILFAIFSLNRQKCINEEQTQ